jgi:phosphomannomutase
VSDVSELDPVIDRVIAANPGQAEQFRGGKEGVLGFFVGQVLKETGGTADPRVLSERLRDRELDLTDGIKVFEDRGWAQVLPDPDEPVVHIYAEGKTSDDSQALESDLHALVEEILQADQAPVGSAGP